jgi:hypothetical protein
MFNILVSKWIATLTALTDFLLKGRWGRSIGKGVNSLTSEGTENTNSIGFIEMLVAMVLFWGGLFLLFYIGSTISERRAESRRREKYPNF